MTWRSLRPARMYEVQHVSDGNPPSPLPRGAACRQRRSRPVSGVLMKLEPTQPASPTSSFSLASLLLLMTLLCVSFGLFSVAPWIGVPFWIITQTAWLGTLDITQQWAARGFFPHNNV